MWKYLLASFGILLPVTFMLPALSLENNHVNFFDASGAAIGEATLTQTSQGVLIRTQLHNLPEGWHAFHIHQTGKCIAPDFKSAGGHFNPTNREHGFENPTGSHAGDLPNVFVGSDGDLNVEVLASNVTLDKGPNSLLDSDGSALVLHAAQDDYKSNPAGNAGSRIACGVIQ